jgi:hypothetical protein
MRNIFFAFIGFVLVSAAASCRKSSTASCNDPVIFNLKDTVTLCYDGVAKWSKDQKTTIHFNKVLGDNRCPQDVVCIVAGGVKVSLDLAQASGSKQDSVWVGDNTGGALTDSVILGSLKVRLLEVKPYPAKANVAIPQEDYKIKLLITERKPQ